MMGACGIVLDRTFMRHRAPMGHPERPDRIDAVVTRLESWGHLSRLTRVAPRRAEREWIEAVHSKSHFESVRMTDKEAFSTFDPDTYAGPDSFEVALLAAGSCVALVERILRGELQAGFALVRPPGHHAETDRAMGFCLFNNAAVAAEWALKQGKARKVAIVDFDVHHGNGTQEIFYSRSDVLYVSQHQFPFYPGTGDFSETGSGEGRGCTVNFPIRAGMGDSFYRSLFRDCVLPVLRRFRPDLILVSAGYDAHRLDPLGGMKLTEEGYGEIANLLNLAARELCQGRIAYILEGGYHLEGLARSVQTTLATTLEPQSFEILPEEHTEDYTRYRQVVRRYLGI